MFDPCLVHAGEKRQYIRQNFASPRPARLDVSSDNIRNADLHRRLHVIQQCLTLVSFSVCGNQLGPAALKTLQICTPRESRAKLQYLHLSCSKCERGATSRPRSGAGCFEVRKITSAQVTVCSRHISANGNHHKSGRVPDALTHFGVSSEHRGRCSSCN